MIAAIISASLGILWAIAIKPLDAPDEPAHLQAVMEVRQQHRLPEIHLGSSQSSVDSAGDATVRQYAVRLGNPYSLVAYESTQPPVYYVVAGLVAILVPPDPAVVLYASRFVAVLFGAGTVYFCWAAARQFAPWAPQWALAVAGVVALLPQFCFASATASNDSAANCAGAAAFYVWFRGLRQEDYDPWCLRAGAILGLALLAKLTAVALIPGLGLVLLFRAWSVPSGPGSWGARLQRGVRLVGGALLAAGAVCGWWLLRNILTYGEPTGTGDALRYYTGQFVRLDLTDPVRRAQFLQFTWESAWGRFGWLDHPLPGELYVQAGYLTLALLALTGAAGVLVVGRRLVRRQGLPVHTVQATLVMTVVSAALAGGYLEYNLTVGLEAQARYLFLLLLPAALLTTGGLGMLAPGRIGRSIALAFPLVWLAGLNVVSLAVLFGVH